MAKTLRNQRRQTQTNIKKPTIITTKNIFLHDLKFKSILPKSIFNKLAQASQFAISLLEDYIGHSEEETNDLSLMKIALKDQELILKDLSIERNQNLDTENVSIIQNPQEQIEQSHKNLINETKQSLNMNNEINPQIEIQEEDDNFLLIDSLINEPKQNSDHFFHFEERNFATSIPPNEQMDFFSLI